jgi:hypothetical protein
MAKETQNIGIQVLAPVIDENTRYISTKPLKGDEAKAVYEEVSGRIKKDFKNAPVFKQYFQFNEQSEEINGSSTYLGILINNALSKNSLWIPTIQEAKQLDVSGKLSNGVYRDFGMAVYSEKSPNQEVAKRLIEEAKKRGRELPVLAPFKALDIIKTGVKISFKKDAEGIIFGEEAKQYLEQFNYKGNSGACGLCRDGDGDWDAIWDALDGSDSGGRVDFVCGEATAKNLEESVLSIINDLAQKKVEALNDRITSAKEIALKTLKRQL